MNKQEALREWRGHYLPAIKHRFEADGIADYPARCESWGAFTDMLCKEGRITSKQYSTWSAPRECGR